MSEETQPEVNEAEKKDDAMDMFETATVPRMVLKCAIPAMIAVLFSMLYNLADTLFIGMTHNDMMVAAVSLCTPLFTIFTAVGTIFGVGGGSVISRAMGAGRKEYSRKVSSFSVWTGLVCGLVLMVLFFIFMNPILRLLGAGDTTFQYAKDYLQMIAIAGPFAVLPSAAAHIIRCEGKSVIASAGMIGGNVLNIILDPILILACGMGTRGAGLATLISMLSATIFYLVYFIWKSPLLSVKFSDFSVKEKIVPNVLAIGIPACLGSLMISVSTIIMQAQVATYNDNALAAVGVALKVLMIATLLAGGIGQGVQAALGYCIGAKKFDRFNSTLRFSWIFAFIFCLVLGAFCFIFAEPIVKLFLTEEASVSYAVHFSRILLWTSPLTGMFYVSQNTVQATGAGGKSLALNLSRQGYVLIPLMFIFNAIMGVDGILWAQPISDIISLALAMILLFTTLGSLRKKAETTEPAAQEAE